MNLMKRRLTQPCKGLEPWGGLIVQIKNGSRLYLFQGVHQAVFNQVAQFIYI